MNWFVAVFGLLLLVLVHELGHFLAAKAVGMRAIRFSIGFPPHILRRQAGDTEYAFGLIPLGGYVKIPGMLRPDEHDLYEVDELLDRAEQVPEQELAAIGVAQDEVRGDLARGRYDRALLSIGDLRSALEAAEPHLTPRQHKRAWRAVDRVTDGLDPRAYWRCTRPRRLAVILAGPAANVLAAFLILTAVNITGRPDPVVRPVVAAVQAKTPAQAMGLRAGDRIVTIDGNPIDRFGQARSAIGGSNGQPVTVVVSRDGRTVTLPSEKPIRSGNRWILGFSPDVIYRTHGVPVTQAPGEAAGDIWRITSGTMSALAHVVSPQGRQQISSTVGIVRYTATVADIGAAYYLSVLALISLSLAIFNLLPFLPLDGGHVVMIAAERLRGGRPLSRGVYERASVIGIMLMMLLFVIGLQNDVNSIISSSP